MGGAHWKVPYGENAIECYLYFALYGYHGDEAIEYGWFIVF